jgi:hypothetical protein
MAGFMDKLQKKRIFLASEARCGSTYLAEKIAYSVFDSYGIELWDLAQEHFSSINFRSKIDDIRHIASNLWTNKLGYQCCKIMCPQISIITKVAKTNPDLKEIFFGSTTKWIILRRKDRIRQAASLAHAQKTGQFHVYDCSQSKASDMSHEEIRTALDSVIYSDEYLRIFGEKIDNSSEYFYEDLLKNEKNTFIDVIKYLNLPIDISKLAISPAKIKRTEDSIKKKLSDSYSDFFLENYYFQGAINEH